MQGPLFCHGCLVSLKAFGEVLVKSLLEIHVGCVGWITDCSCLFELFKELGSFCKTGLHFMKTEV